MLPTINGKALYDCKYDDLKEMIDNADYGETIYIDYKGDLSALRCDKGVEKDKAIAEFRADVCSFANTEGGYLVYGIKEVEKVPCELTGIIVDNREKFEQTVKNWLQSIHPRIPNYSISYIDIDESTKKSVVIICIKNDMYAPYVFVENQKDYRIFKRVGADKTVVSYMELKQMFLQGAVLEKEIMSFRTKRIEEIRRLTNRKHFLLLHIIPENFMDSSYNNLMILKEQSGVPIASMFGNYGCATLSIPMAGGLRYLSYRGSDECRIYNNGIVECCDCLEEYCDNDSSSFKNFPIVAIWEKIKGTLIHYKLYIHDELKLGKVFLCFSIVGCNGVKKMSELSDQYAYYIDSDVLMSEPIICEDVQNDEQFHRRITEFNLDFYLSVGSKSQKHLQPLINELHLVSSDES